ncbi:MAG: hypothetical protein QW597_00430 [Thermoplasmataceae archaeon]
MDDEYNRIQKIVASHYEISETGERGGSYYFRIPGLANYPEGKFSELVDELSSHGYVVFTSGMFGDELYVIKSVSQHRNRNLIRSIMVALTIASLWYTGYTYQEQYTHTTSFFANTAVAFLLFVLPIIGVLGLRELARFYALRRNSMKYEAPLFIPDPFGIGTMGVINLPSRPFKTRRSLLEAGSFPIIAGFIGSLFLIIVGNIAIPASNSYAPGVNSPINTVSLPIIYPILINFFYPVSSVPNIIAYSGWVCLIVNSFNAIPAGFLDGGLVSVGLFGGYSRYVSYISIIGLVLIGLTYTPWFILAVFVVILGIRGPEPLGNIYRPLKFSRVIGGIAIIILFLGLVPFPFHVSESHITASVSDPNFLIINGTPQNANFTVYVKNGGISSMVPAFSVSPLIGYTFSSERSSPIDPGGSALYHVTLETQNLNRTGYYNYTLTTYYGGSSSNIQLTVILVNTNFRTDPLTLNPPGFANNGGKLSETWNGTVNITVENTGEVGLNISAYIFTDTGNSYRYTVGTETVNRSAYGSATILSPGGNLQVKGQLQLQVTPVNVTGEMTLLVTDTQFDAAVVYISFQPPPSEPRYIGQIT